jgi:O-antigen/teichoic acid export membrane protein
LRQTFVHIRSSKWFRRAAKNAGWSGLGFLVAPALQLLATPYLIEKLGIDVYGIWMLLNSVISVSGLASLGFGAAAIKFVSKYRARGEPEMVIRVLRSTLALFILLAGTLALISFLFAPDLIVHFTHLSANQRLLIISGSRIASLAVFMRFIYSVVEAAAQGHERYDIESWFAILNSVLSIGGACFLASIGRGLLDILWLNVAVLGIGMIGLSIIMGRLIGNYRWLAPGINRAVCFELGGFAIWSWVQSIGTLLYSQVDRLIIGAMLGPAFLSYYVVCVQLAVLTHGLLCRTVSFIFPMAAAMHESGDTSKFRKVYNHGMAFSISAGFALNLPLFLFPQSILAAWLGADTALNSAPILPYVAFANALLASTSVQYFLLNGAGYVRLNAIACLVFGVSVALATILLIPKFGLIGAALARLFDLPIWMALRHSIHARILKDKNYWVSLIAYCIVIIGFACVLPVQKLAANTTFNAYTLSFLIVTSVCIGFLFFYLLTARLYCTWPFKEKYTLK